MYMCIYIYTNMCINVYVNALFYVYKMPDCMYCIIKKKQKRRRCVRQIDICMHTNSYVYAHLCTIEAH